MDAKDYIFSGIFIGLIFLQIRGRPLTARSLLLPVVIVAFFAYRYLNTFPTGGNNLILVAICAGIGLTLGLLSATVTTVRTNHNGVPIAKAGPFAVLLWIVGTGSRLAFAIYATNGGGPAIAHFSRTYHIDSRTAITTALILMALCEVIGRYGLLALRAHAARQNSAPPTTHRNKPNKAAETTRW